MKKWIILILCTMLLITGCTSKKAETPKPSPAPDNSHLTAQQDGLTVEVSNELRTFPKTMISTKEGFEIVGISVVVINKTQNNVPISPKYVTLTAIDNTEYKYSEVTESIAGKGAFKEVTLPHDYRGGGLLLFELEQGVKIDSVHYKDESNHDITIKFESGESSGV